MVALEGMPSHQHLLGWLPSGASVLTVCLFLHTTKLVSAISARWYIGMFVHCVQTSAFKGRSPGSSSVRLDEH